MGIEDAGPNPFEMERVDDEVGRDHKAGFVDSGHDELTPEEIEQFEYEKALDARHKELLETTEKRFNPEQAAALKKLREEAYKMFPAGGSAIKYGMVECLVEDIEDFITDGDPSKTNEFFKKVQGKVVEINETW